MRTSLFVVLAAAALATGVAPQASADFRVIATPPAPVATPVPATTSAPPATSVPAATPWPAAAPAPSVAPRQGYAPLDGLAERGDPASAKPSSKGFGLVALSYVGTPPAEIEIRQGMGRNVRLSDALRQIAPVGWRGFGRADIADSFDPKHPVSWKGGRPWTDVLDILANEQDLAIEVDWQRKHLYVGKREYVKPQTVAASTAAPKASAAPIPVMWTAKVGATVRSTFEEWAKRAGWTVVWPMEDLDYRIVAPLSFDGSIVDAASKLTRLFESAERPIAVSIHTNQKLMVFSEKGATR